MGLPETYASRAGAFFFVDRHQSFWLRRFDSFIAESKAICLLFNSSAVCALFVCRSCFIRLSNGRRIKHERQTNSLYNRKSCLFSRHDCPKRSEEHTSELQSRQYLVCRLLLEKKIMTILWFL